jgi:ATP-dependent Lhr-like helicase
MELRGEARGGRFIGQVGGEQFALESAVSRLRDLRDAGNSSEWALISAADPLNLTGVLPAAARIPGVHKNSLVLQNGRCVAAKIAGRIEFFAEVDPAQQVLMRKSLQIGRRVWPAPEPTSAVPEPHVFRRPGRTTMPDDTQLHSRRRFGV